MDVTRRGIFGLMAAAPVMAKSVATSAAGLFEGNGLNYATRGLTSVMPIARSRHTGEAECTEDPSDGTIRTRAFAHGSNKIIDYLKKNGVPEHSKLEIMAEIKNDLKFFNHNINGLKSVSDTHKKKMLIDSAYEHMTNYYVLSKEIDTKRQVFKQKLLKKFGDYFW